MLRRLSVRLMPSCCRYGGKVDISTVQESAEADQGPNGHDGYGTVKKFEEHWATFFAGCPDVFELQRGLNNCFNYDLVPPSNVIEAALLACRRLNCFATGVRVFGALRGKVANEEQYEQYKEHFKPL